MGSHDVMPELFKSMEVHGMGIGNDGARALEELTILPQRRENIGPRDVSQLTGKMCVEVCFTKSSPLSAFSFTNFSRRRKGKLETTS
jgi:hypothetical protein